jgi:hypothetical protein
MARRSKRKNLQTLSLLLLLAFIALATTAVAAFRRGDLLTGLQLGGWALVSLAFMLAFTWRTKCRVETTQRKPCRNDAYGFLFGCSTVGHKFGKFYARLGFHQDIEEPVRSRQQNRNYGAFYQEGLGAAPVRVVVEDNGLGVCAFWVGVVSAVAGVVQVVTAFALH